MIGLNGPLDVLFIFYFDIINLSMFLVLKPFGRGFGVLGFWGFGV